MTTRKRNEFLDIVSSDDEQDNDRGYDSEAVEESKGRSVKRRRTHTRADGVDFNSDSASDIEDSSADEKEHQPTNSTRQKRKQDPHNAHEADDSASQEEDDDAERGVGSGVDEEEEDEEEEGENDDGDQYLDLTGDDDGTTSANGKKSSKSKPVRIPGKNKKNKTGVVYLSSLPPYMKPFALKSLLEARGFSPITKVFLTPAVRAPSAPRRRSNKRKTYTDGWVEFASKKTAKICAETLNASIIGGRKGGWYHDDILCLKYLRGFKWADLHEQIQRERSEREAKRRIEDTRARKEEKVFLQGYETGKMLDGIQRKNEEKRKRKMQAGDGDAGREEAVRPRRLFKQSDVKHGRDKILQDKGVLEEETRRVLGKIF